MSREGSYERDTVLQITFLEGCRGGEGCAQLDHRPSQPEGIRRACTRSLPSGAVPEHFLLTPLPARADFPARGPPRLYPDSRLLEPFRKSAHSCITGRRDSNSSVSL